MTLTDVIIFAAVAAGSYYVYNKSQNGAASVPEPAPVPIPVPPPREPVQVWRPAYQGALFPINQSLRDWKQNW